ncbi:MAG: 4Fe-4S dicluster domain-containing protein [Parasphingorhabdus sp.]|nr:4Fe-4S dicluster domain-containing protein [Parasphingorhabdus sp.]
MPARRRCGPICSCWSSAGSRATATPASGLQNAPWSLGKVAQACQEMVDLAAHRASRLAAPGSSISPMRRRWLRDFVDRRGRRPLPMSTVAVLTATTFVFGGFMREQVCIYMCPWPRIQAAMLDEDSLIVTYNDWRGEPRGSAQESAKAVRAKVVATASIATPCVAVCPTGIDIREGPAARLHHLRAVHRCLRQGDGTDWPPPRVNRLSDAGR